MSISTYRSTLQRLTDRQAGAQRALANQMGKVARLRADVTRLSGEASRTSSPSFRASKLRATGHKERDLVAAEKRLGDLMTKKSRLDARVGTATSDLQRAQDADARSRERHTRRRGRRGVADVRGPAPGQGPTASSRSLVGRLLLPGPESASAPSTPPARHRPGRPKGPYLLQSREEIETAIGDLRREQGRRPYWKDVALHLGVDERTLLQARRAFGMDDQASRPGPATDMTTV